jgi:hypothetical protein
MDFKHVVGLVEESKEFKDFIKNNKEYYLVHVFSLLDSEHKDVWQIGYYSKDTDKLVVFEHNNDFILIHPPEDALKKEEYIKKLELEELETSRGEAVDICDALLKENYPHESLTNAIFLLQNLPEFGQIWNITIVTTTFSVINVKINAVNGKILKHKKENLMNWKV